jgi:hypothetical protein
MSLEVASASSLSAIKDQKLLRLQLSQQYKLEKDWQHI